MIKKIITLFFILISSILFSKTYEQVYTYRAIEADSRLSARTISYENVLRLLLDDIVSDLEMEVDTNKYSCDKIRAFTADFIKSINIIEEDWNGDFYYLKAQTELEIFDLKNEMNNISKKKMLKLMEIQNNKEKCFQKIKKVREKLYDANSEEEISDLSEIYKETISENIYEFIPFIDGDGEAAVKFEQEDSTGFYRKRVFVIAFCDALLDIMQKINIPLYESGVYKFLTEQENE